MSVSQTLVKTLEERIASYRKEVKHEHVGTVVQIGDGIAKISGLSRIGSSEMIDFGQGVMGVAFNLEEDSVGAIILGDFTKIKEGDTVKATGKILSVPVGEGLVGRVVSPLGESKDGGPSIKAKEHYPVEKIAPRVIERKSVTVPLQTGIAAIDSMIPIGRGQRELIIGDRQTGKTAIVIDTILNQKETQKSDRPVICIYVAIGQRESKIAKIVKELKARGAMDYTIVVSASAADPAPLSYVAPFAGCSMGEYFVAQGKDVLCIFDDLSKHAWAYRQISLVLRRPPGREAYPGDVFYLHSRLLERACCLDEKHGGGTLTALPIIETQAGDLSAYIPTNVISITDGQIFLESDLFYKGIRPAVNVGLSVSRVGSAAQRKSMKKVAGKLRLELAQYRELAVFAQFGSDLDPETRRQLDRGARLTELLKQLQYQPLPVGEQVASLYAGTQGYLDDIPVDSVKKFEKEFITFLKARHPKILEALSDEIKPEFEEQLKRLIGSFKETFSKN
ncbi:F0F1 ATP synthase subunit alpha [Candidatus Peribacteria bacterium RIFCSPLOWO2_01_FULL_51_18]|nr:MAG: F0F1 ATP synthase subunit alpha [Candidatus Peribacteria bacterium RIFCSPHIGHO2_02_FULL_51_15]OGJ66237.1 MAG: F0F1 ATP synthase subunit alpha [Candidatus Peribacteria bacterium RIFCSPLOWO2_01_FULL_51_18]OGJ67976.1 MAG: F0F1 ATP synthase subunit alpha [Candidatus Peribacteria bacterium RIFCSPLOWO2_02_FULL_51_10]